MEVLLNKLTDGSGNPITDLVKADVTLRDPDNAATVYDYTALSPHLGLGCYVLWGVNFSYRPVRLYIRNVVQNWYGVQSVGDKDSVYMRKDGTYIDANGKKISNGAAAAASTDFVIFSQLDDYVKTSGDQNVGGNKSFTGRIYLGNEAVAENEPPTLLQMLEAINGISFTPFQESSNVVVIIPDGTEQPHKVYKTIAAGIASFTDPGESKQCACLIKGTGGVSKFITLSHSSLVNYVHLIGYGKHVNMILGSTGASTSKNLIMANMTIYMGGEDITSDRTYIGTKFANVDIYAYKNITFNSCELSGSGRIFQPAGKKIILAGSTIVSSGWEIMQDVDGVETVNANGGHFAGTGGLNLSFSMPADPTIAT